MTDNNQKKVYIAGRFGRQEEVRRIQELFKKKGYAIAVDWTTHKPIKPYGEHQELSKQYAIEDIEAAAHSDVFVLLSDDAGTGMYIELGAAITNYTKFGKPKIFVLGTFLERSMFYFHPSINRRRTIEEILEEI